MTQVPASKSRRRVVPVSVIIVAAGAAVIAIVGGMWLAFGPQWLGGGSAAELEAAKEAYETGDYAAAESQLSKIVVDDAGDLEARKALALALAAQGKNEEALEQYAAVVAADPKDHESLYEMAVIEQRIGKAQEAIGHLEAAIMVAEEPSYYAALAPIYASVGKWAECIDAWTKYLELAELNEPAQAEVHAAMASAYEGMREYDKAKAELEQALFLDPNNAQYKSRLEGYAN